MRQTDFILLLIVLLKAAGVSGLFGQETIPVEGIANHGIYGDPVSFRVAAEPGHRYACALDGQPVPADEWVQVNEANYHQLFIRRTRLADGQVDERRLDFVVYFKGRGTSEIGLPIFTPCPVIPSAGAEFTGLVLRLAAPEALPVGLDLPVIARLEHPDGRPAWLNGTVALDGLAPYPLELRRGFGARLLLPPAGTGGARELSARLHGLRANRSVVIEESPAWSAVGGSITGAVVWPTQARVQVTNMLEIAPGASLQIGAGAIVKLAPLVNVVVGGRLAVQGTLDQPVVFMPEQADRPWGGFIAQTNTARLELTGTILTGGGGDPTYFSTHFGQSHRMNQAVFLLHHGAQAHLTNCFLIDNPGQAGNGYGGFLTLDHCLVQRCLLTGEFGNGGGVTVLRSALIEFPVDSAQFIDYDNDALYLTEGTHEVRDSVLGWAKDDGLDAGSGYAGRVVVSNCWFEACFHEGMAWSGGGRVAEVTDTVAVNCGQGIEAGWSHGTDSPLVHAERVLCINNLVGARFGDNYDFAYNGFLRVTNSLMLFNQRDVWGLNFQDWTYRTNQMDIRDNWLTAPHPLHPGNQVWDAATDGARLAPFVPGGSGRPVGIGLAVRHTQDNLTAARPSVPVGLSCFATQAVEVDYVIRLPLREPERGRLHFAPGQMVQFIATSAWPAAAGAAQVTLMNPAGGELTGRTEIYFVEETPAQEPRIHLFREPERLVAAWSDPACVLEASDHADGVWQAVPGAGSPRALSLNANAQFYRLRK